MKKILAFVLVAVMLVAASASVYAVDSATTSAPKQIHSAAGCTDCSIVAWGQRDQLPDAKKAAFEAAKDVLKDAVPEGFACRNFVYHDVEGACTTCNIQLVMNGVQTLGEDDDILWARKAAEGFCAAYSVDLSMEGTTEVVIKQYVDNKWVQNDVSVDGNIVAVKAVADGPVAIFMK